MIPQNTQRMQLEATHAMAKYLDVLGDQTVGRGVQKSNLTPAQRLGLHPQNPTFFGIQGKNAVPYQNIIANGDNLKAVMEGYEDMGQGDNAVPMEVAGIMANVNRSKWLVSEAYDNKKRESIYAGIQRNPALNLYELNKRRKRDSLYSLQ